ncbi:MAG TPA: hypothetical protein VGE09_08330 [Pseudoxanthomonas sp.]
MTEEERKVRDQALRDATEAARRAALAFLTDDKYVLCGPSTLAQQMMNAIRDLISAGDGK